MPKHQDTQEVTVNILNGQSGGQATVTHNLADADGNDITPTSILTEIVAINRTGAATPESLWTVVERSSPEDGTFVLTVLGSQNDNGDTTIVTVRVTSLYWHSIQGSDHTA